MNSRSIFPASAANRNIDQGSSNSRLQLLLLLQSFNEVNLYSVFHRILRKTILITFDLLSRPFLYETFNKFSNDPTLLGFSNVRLNVTIFPIVRRRRRRRKSGNESDVKKKEFAEFFYEENCTKRICVHRDGRKKKLIEIESSVDNPATRLVTNVIGNLISRFVSSRGKPHYEVHI